MEKSKKGNEHQEDPVAVAAVSTSGKDNMCICWRVDVDGFGRKGQGKKTNINDKQQIFLMNELAATSHAKKKWYRVTDSKRKRKEKREPRNRQRRKNEGKIQTTQPWLSATMMLASSVQLFLAIASSLAREGRGKRALEQDEKYKALGENDIKTRQQNKITKKKKTQTRTSWDLTFPKDSPKTYSCRRDRVENQETQNTHKKSSVSRIHKYATLPTRKKRKEQKEKSASVG